MSDPTVNPPPAVTPSGTRLSRRNLLRAMGIGGAALATAPLLAACGGSSTAAASGVGTTTSAATTAASAIAGSSVSGGKAFDWMQAKGKTLRMLRTPHPYVSAFDSAGLFKDFTAKTGINIAFDDIPEGDYFTKLTSELSGSSSTYDVFMTGAYFIWQYGPPGWMEDLAPYITDSSKTSPDYNFEDIFEGLRTSTRWDFKKGSALGSGGQWAIPWGFETNVVAYNKEVFDKKGIKPATTFDNFIQLATDLTDKSAGTYGVAFRGSKSWATIHPGFMTQFTREGGKDYSFADGQYTATMNSDKAVAFTKKWADLAKTAGPSGWTAYEYPNCTQDLADGKAMMVYDADSATYPKFKGTKVAGKLGWDAGPAGPDGSYGTNLWTWSLAMNKAAKDDNKLAAWLFIQWATSSEVLSKAAASGSFADPVRKTVFDGAFKTVIGSSYPGYLETFEKVIGSTKIQFTPQTQFFDTTEAWAGALQDIYGGADAKTSLDALAKANADALNNN
ncbi:multiple sugar transport system substrate-binding protein [Nakamurella sp. UYEF19]